jgi:hypothetical protein
MVLRNLLKESGTVAFHGTIDSSDENQSNCSVGANYPTVIVTVETNAEDDSWEMLKKKLLPRTTITLNEKTCDGPGSEVNLYFDSLDVHVDSNEIDVVNQDGGSADVHVFNDEKVSFEYLSGVIMEIFLVTAMKIQLKIEVTDSDIKLLKDLEK